MSSCPFCRANLSDVDLQREQCSSCGRALLFDEHGVLWAAPDGSSPGDVTLEHTPEEGTGDTADEHRIGETLQAGGMQGASPEKEEKGTADEHRFAETLEPGSVQDGSPEKEEKGTADESRFAETLEPGSVQDGSPEKDEKGTADESRFAETLEPGSVQDGSPEKDEKGTADESRFAETLEPGSVQDGSPAKDDDEKGTADEVKFAGTIESGISPEPAGPEGDKGTADSRSIAATYDTGGLSQEAADRVSMIWSGKCRPETSPRTSIKVEAETVESEARLVIPSRVLSEGEDEAKATADFELISQLGEGGMGVVHAARQASIDRTVAIKMLKPAGAEDPEARGKFLSEAVVTGDLEHPNIVPIYDVGKSEAGALFYAMKCVKGTPWEAAIVGEDVSGEPRDPDEGCRRGRLGPLTGSGSPGPEARERDAGRFWRSAVDGLGFGGVVGSVVEEHGDGGNSGLHGPGDGHRAGGTDRACQRRLPVWARSFTRSSRARRRTRART